MTDLLKLIFIDFHVMQFCVISVFLTCTLVSYVMSIWSRTYGTFANNLFQLNVFQYLLLVPYTCVPFIGLFLFIKYW